MMAMTLLRRSRRRLAHAVALGALLVVNACGPATDGGGVSTDETTSMAPTASTGEGASTSTGEMPQPFRRFGGFHWEQNAVLYENPPDKVFSVWITLEIHEDGTLTEVEHNCTSLIHTHVFSWVDIGDGAIRVVPAKVSPEGTFMFGADQVEAVTISVGDGCDDIMVLVEYATESGKADLLYRYLPGALCAEGTKCDFKFVWCDGTGPVSCS